MALPILEPESLSSKSILPARGDVDNVTCESLPFATYINCDTHSYWTVEQEDSFKKGAADQVAYTYKQLGGDVLDIELTEKNVYAAYEEAVLEYSYHILLGHARNTMSDFLGSTTGQFDENGQLLDDAENEELRGANQAYPKFKIGYARQIGEGLAGEAGVGGDYTYHMSYIDVVNGQQDYDLEAAISNDPRFNGLVEDKNIIIKKVFWKTRRSTWNFYAYFGAISVASNGSHYGYGQYADSATFEVVPVWEHKLQAAAYQDALEVRTSNFSYLVRNNKLRLFPTPQEYSPRKFYFEFIIDEGPFDPILEFDEDGNPTYVNRPELNGVSGLNNLPFENIPYDSINSVGKQWIRKYALARTKIMLGLIRSKFTSIPIPGESITLNGPELITQGKEEEEALKDDLKDMIEQLSYGNLLEEDAKKVENAETIMSKIPLKIYRM